MNDNKFNEGDIVEFCNNKAVVKRVHSRKYFYSGDSYVHLYDIEYMSGGSLSEISESALNLISKAGEVQVNTKRHCECGAWAVHWATEEHSRWCPMYNFSEKEQEDYNFYE